MPSLFEGLSAGTQWLFLIFTMLTALATVIYGWALLRTRLLPTWMGWLAVVYGVMEIAVLIFTGDLPPFCQYIIPLVFGITLLLRKSHVSANIDDEAPARIQAAAS
jgi:D-alanyl-lipoteichoic acid acyltransferase DltB (MBOAT superfamily)